MWHHNPTLANRVRAALLTSAVLLIATPVTAQTANPQATPASPSDPATAAAAADAVTTGTNQASMPSGNQPTAVDPTKDAAAQAAAKEIVIQGHRFTDTGASSATKLQIPVLDTPFSVAAYNGNFFKVFYGIRQK